MVSQDTREEDNDEWVMNKDAEESRLAVVIEVKSPAGDWVEKEVTFFDESGVYTIQKDE